MLKRTIPIFLASALLCAVAAVSASAFGGLTIEELIERYGISRQSDRIVDIREVMMSSAELTDLLPEQYRSPVLNEIIGDESISSLWKSWEKNRDSLYKAGTTFWQELAGISPKEIIGSAMLSSGVGSGTEYSTLKNFDWQKDAVKQEAPRRTVREYYTASGEKSEFQKANEELDVLDINATIEEFANESMGDDYTESMKDFGPEAVTSSAVALAGIAQQPYAYSDTKVQRAHLSDYTLNAGGEKIEKIIDILAEAENIRSAAVKQFSDRLKETTGTYSAGYDEFGGQGGAWKATAAGYATIARHNLDRQMLIAQMYKLMALNIRMRNQYFSTFMYDYVTFTKNRLDEALEEERQNKGVD